MDYSSIVRREILAVFEGNEKKQSPKPDRRSAMSGARHAPIMPVGSQMRTGPDPRGPERVLFLRTAADQSGPARTRRMQ